MSYSTYRCVRKILFVLQSLEVLKIYFFPTIPRCIEELLFLSCNLWMCYTVTFLFCNLWMCYNSFVLLSINVLESFFLFLLFCFFCFCFFFCPAISRCVKVTFSLLQSLDVFESYHSVLQSGCVIGFFFFFLQSLDVLELPLDL